MREAGDRGWWQRVGEEGGMGVVTLSVPFCTLRGLDIWKQRGREGWGGESRCMGIQRSLHMHARQTYELAVAGGEITLKGRSKQWI